MYQASLVRRYDSSTNTSKTVLQARVSLVDQRVPSPALRACHAKVRSDKTISRSKAAAARLLHYHPPLLHTNTRLSSQTKSLACRSHTLFFLPCAPYSNKAGALNYHHHRNLLQPLRTLFKTAHHETLYTPSCLLSTFRSSGQRANPLDRTSGRLVVDICKAASNTVAPYQGSKSYRARKPASVTLGRLYGNANFAHGGKSATSSCYTLSLAKQYSCMICRLERSTRPTADYPYLL